VARRQQRPRGSYRLEQQERENSAPILDLRDRPLAPHTDERANRSPRLAPFRGEPVFLTLAHRASRSPPDQNTPVCLSGEVGHQRSERLRFATACRVATLEAPRSPPSAEAAEFQSCPPLPASSSSALPFVMTSIAGVRIPQSPKAALFIFRMRSPFESGRRSAEGEAVRQQANEAQRMEGRRRRGISKVVCWAAGQLTPLMVRPCSEER